MKRYKSIEVKAGNIGIGGNNPIRVQTMTNTDTLDIEATVKQIKKCAQAGAELIRIATPAKKHLNALEKIKIDLNKLNINIPLIADVHYLPEVAFEALKVADKVRINPGNFDKKVLREFILEAKKLKKAVRVGTNHGSLRPDIFKKYGNTPKGMIAQTMEFLKIFKKLDFDDLVVAVKASDPPVMIEANRFLIKAMEKEDMRYPLHLGVTEAGNGSEGIVKSTLGIGTLLMEGIGDTIRVSLTGNPEKEMPVAYDILQATGRRITKTEFIACPGCGRTLFDIEKTLNTIKKEFKFLSGVKIAVMGCVVNGLGEMRDADYAYIGGAKGKINLYANGKLIKRGVSEKLAVNELKKIINQ